VSQAGRSAAKGSRVWTIALRVFYRFLRLVDPPIRLWYRLFGLADTAELIVSGRRSGRPRSILVGLLVVDGAWYVGHPNGHAEWTRNLEAVAAAEVRRKDLGRVRIVAEPLSDAAERERVIAATWRQHPFPGNLVYWLARRHIRAVGRYYRLVALD
jgi:deazaflavin-dependent oxidoreductase (nitroreductase family)